MPGKIVFVCGHSRWGKSLTLRPLTGDVHQGRVADVGNPPFRVEKMSNDDVPDDRDDRYFRRLSAHKPEAMPRLIATLCPRTDDPRVPRLLGALRRRGYRLYFWVLELQFSGPGVITSDELDLLRRYGDVEIFGRRVESSVRADALRRFIRRRVVRE
jgi:hypothetical protein